MTQAESFFNALTLEIPDVKPGKMFGALCMKSPNGKSGVMFWHENIVVKLQGDSFKEVMKLEGAKLFEPMEGRPMKEWVCIPFAYKDQWKKYALESSGNAAAILKKEKTGE